MMPINKIELETLERKFRNYLINLGYGTSETKFSIAISDRKEIGKIVSSRKEFVFKEAIRIRDHVYITSTTRYFDRSNLKALFNDIASSRNNDIFCIVMQKPYQFNEVGYIFYQGGENTQW